MSKVRILGAILLGVALTQACEKADTPAEHAATTPLRIGDPTPAYDAVTLAGRSVAIGRPSNGVTVVNVWATWCTSCREEMSDLESLHSAYRDSGVHVIAVSVDAGSEALVRRFTERQQLTFDVVHDRAARLQSIFQVAGVPSTYVIDREGRLRWQRTGGLHGAIADVHAAVGNALRDTLPSANPH